MAKKKVDYRQPTISIHLCESELSPGIEMILQDVQGIMKYKMDESRFYDKLTGEINRMLKS